MTEHRNVLPEGTPRPWSKMAARHAVPLRYKGHPHCQQDIWLDRSNGLLQIHAPNLPSVFDARRQVLWMPSDAWEQAEARDVQQVEWCVRSDVTCYRVSGWHALIHGKPIERGVQGSPTERWIRWSVPLKFATSEQVTQDDKQQALL